MAIFNQNTIDEVSDSCDSITRNIQDFSEELSGIMESYNDDYNSLIEDYNQVKNNVINKINDNSYFKPQVKEYLVSRVSKIESELGEEDFEMDLTIDENDIYDNYSSGADRFMSRNTDIDSHMRYVNSAIEESLERIKVISRISDYVKPKHKFIIEKRKGIICIKDKNHRDYSINKSKDISIDNGEVLFFKEGIWNPEFGWIIPEDLVDEFKKIKVKLNELVL
jgi:hypothetical protein